MIVQVFNNMRVYDYCNMEACDNRVEDPLAGFIKILVAQTGSVISKHNNRGKA